jgi:hypothetical protein
MTLNGTGYRSFYPQNDLYFNFTLSDYTSRDFEIGLSGNNYVYFSFKSGLIRDKFNNLIGSFNGEPISFTSYIQTGLWNYYINEVPVARNLSVDPASVFSSIVSKIHDGNKIELDAYVKGTNYPTLDFYDFKTTSVGLSGKLKVTNGSYGARIFEAESSNVSGSWSFPSQVFYGEEYNFFNYDVKDLDRGSAVSLNLNTNFGVKSYSLYVQDTGDEGSATNDNAELLNNDDNEFASIWLYSGNSAIGKEWESVYSIDYAIGPSHSLNVQFNYTVGKTGSTVVSGNFYRSIVYSGSLSTQNGIASGYLYNRDTYFEGNYAWTDSNGVVYGLQSPVTYYPTGGIVSKYFENLTPTGYALLSKDISENFQTIINDNSITSSSFSVDLGGSTGVYSSSISPTDRVYFPKFTYNGVDVYPNSTQRTFSGFVGEEDEGRFTFETLHAYESGVILQTEAQYSSFDFAGNETMLLTPYRGIAFASFEKNMMLYGPAVDGKQCWIFASQKLPTLLFKNLDSISFPREVGSCTMPSNTIVSGFILDRESSYYLYGGRMSFDLAYNPVQGNVFGDLFILRSVQFYNKLGPFDRLDEPLETLYIKKTNALSIDNTDFIPLNPQIDLNANNFFVLPDKSTKVYKSDIPHVCYTFDDPVFFFSEYKNNIVKTSPNNLLPDHFRFEEDTPPIFAYKNALVSQTEILTDTTVYSVSNTNNTNALLYIPFKPKLNQDEITPYQTLVFAFEIKGGISNPLQEIQVALSDELYFSRNSNGVIQEIKPYANFNFSSLTAAESGITRHISASTDGYTRIAVSITCTNDQKISYIILNFINGGLSTPRLAELNTPTSLSADIRRLQLYEGALTTDSPNPKAYDSLKHTFAPIDFETIFSYFIHKIYKIEGNFAQSNRISDGSNGPFRSQKMGIFQPPYPSVNSEITIADEIYGYRITHLFNEPLDNTGADNIAQKIFKFIYFVLTGEELTSTVGTNRKWKYGSRVFATQRTDTLSLFSIATDFSNLYIEDNGVISTYSIDHVTHGEAIAKILEIIRSNSPEITTHNIINNGELLEVPYQLKGERVEIANSQQAYVTQFVGTLPNDTNLFVQYGKGRYYPNNLESNSFGFFYETDDLVNTTSNIYPTLDSIDVFEKRKHELNHDASQTLDTSAISQFNLKRLLFAKQEVDLYSIVNETVFLDNGSFSITSSDSIWMTGLYPWINKRTAKVWEVDIADDEDMLVNKQPIVNLNPDQQSYSLNGIGINDNANRFKYLRVKYLNPSIIADEEQDRASLQVIIKSGVSVVSDKTIAFP